MLSLVRSELQAVHVLQQQRSSSSFLSYAPCVVHVVAMPYLFHTVSESCHSLELASLLLLCTATAAATITAAAATILAAAPAAAATATATESTAGTATGTILRGRIRRLSHSPLHRHIRL
jgi:hypothetical protein